MAGKPQRTYYTPQTICLFDFETNGLDPEEGAEPIELAAVMLDYHTLEEIARFPARLMRVQRPENLSIDYTVKPGDTVASIAKGLKTTIELLNAECPDLASKLDPGTVVSLPCIALGVNGKTRAQVMAAEDPAVVFNEFFDWVLKITKGRGKVLPAGHNVKFDIKFMRVALKQYVPDLAPDPEIDPGERQDLSAYNRIFDYHDICSFNVFYFLKVMTKQARYGNLVNATKHYGLSHAAHEAMGDVEASAEVLRILRREAQRGEAGVKVAQHILANYAEGSNLQSTDPHLWALLCEATGHPIGAAMGTIETTVAQVVPAAT